jgi:glycosyltransferase involved in cell wall biosynthesis
MKETVDAPISLSTVTPVYSGEQYLPELVDNLLNVRKNWEKRNAPIRLVESIFVDDGSQDNSFLVLSELSKKYEWVRVVRLSRNFGQHSATVAGICHSLGDWIVTLDEDLQHDPQHIDQMLKAAVTENCDIIYAQPEGSAHGGTWRDRSSKLVKGILAKLSGVTVMPLFNSFRLLRGGVARAAASSCSSHTYLDIALLWFSKSISSVKFVMHDDRFAREGKSGYNFIGLVNHARKLIVNSNVDFALWGILLGILAIVFSAILALWVLVGSVFLPLSSQAPGWASLLASISLLSGVIIGLVTLILEYVSIMVVNQLGKPVFFTVDRSSDERLKKWYIGNDVCNHHSK